MTHRTSDDFARGEDPLRNLRPGVTNVPGVFSPHPFSVCPVRSEPSTRRLAAAASRAASRIPFVLRSDPVGAASRARPGAGEPRVRDTLAGPAGGQPSARRRWSSRSSPPVTVTPKPACPLPRSRRAPDHGIRAREAPRGTRALPRADGALRAGARAPQVNGFTCGRGGRSCRHSSCRAR